VRGRGAYPAAAESEEDAERREDDGEEDLEERAAAVFRHRDLRADRIGIGIGIGIGVNGGGAWSPERRRSLPSSSVDFVSVYFAGKARARRRICGWGLVRGTEVSRAAARVCRYAAGGAGAGLWTWATAGGLWAVTDRDSGHNPAVFFLPSVLI
jgi:hypothetical protein